MQDRIEKSIELKAPVGRVWRAVTNFEEFGQWFRVKLEGPFEVGEMSHGQITYAGYEHMKWTAMVKAMEPEKLFSFAWCPLCEGREVDFDTEPKTLVEFRLEAIPAGTRLTISESGFSGLPDDPRRIDALRSNTEGWSAQVHNIAAHVES